MPPTYSDWILSYPGNQFITADTARQALITELLSQFWDEHSVSVWGSLQLKAVSYYTAAYLTATAVGLAGSTAFPIGPVTSLTTSQGSQSVGFGQGEGKGGSLEKMLRGNIYGMRYESFKRSLGTVGRVI